MANVTINDEHLINIANELRAQLGETRAKTEMVPLPLVHKTSSATGHDNLGSYVSVSSDKYTAYTVPGATSIKVKATANLNSSSCTLMARAGDYSNSTFTSGINLFESVYSVGVDQSAEETFNGNVITIKEYQKLKYYIEIFGLDADGNEMPSYDVIVEGETVPNVYKPRDMAAAINDIANTQNGFIDGSYPGHYYNDRVEEIVEYGFYKRAQMRSAEFPNVVAMGQYAFYYCSGLEKVVFPKLEILNTRTFYYCSNLHTADFGALENIKNTYDFSNCTKLTALILRGSTVCTLGNTNSLGSTPIASGTGYIYVPSALVESYKAATNWSTYKNQFRAIEDYPDICG
jgi:hypothetical protein